jgi:putative Mg2+ transporter-C (MgtC) family protein
MPDLPGMAPSQSLSFVDMLVRFVVALLLGGALGLDRERLGKPAGLRTHIMVSIGACAFLLLGVELLASVSAQYGSPLDPTHVLQGVVGGIGFLGAGTIIHSQGGVEGITTAATVWVAGAVGAGCGMGQFFIVGVLVVLSISALWVLPKFDIKHSIGEDEH